MIKLNDYLYSGSTVIRIMTDYARDLKAHAIETENPIDLAHSNVLLQMMQLQEHNDFLSEQCLRIHEFYTYMTKEYPKLAFIFKGRIKSLIRMEEKFNGYIVSKSYNHYMQYGTMPTVPELRQYVHRFRDLIAYRIVISIPSCQISDKEARREEEIRILYEIANKLPFFMETRGFTLEEIPAEECKEKSSRLSPLVEPYYKDFIEHPSSNGYQSLHITLFDNMARCYVEVQLRTKAMDDIAEIGAANHFGYERMQEKERSRRDAIPEGASIYFDEAYERVMALQLLDLTGVDVNMFSAADNLLVNDYCGLFRGRLIRPFEHLSQFQND